MIQKMLWSLELISHGCEYQKLIPTKGKRAHEEFGKGNEGSQRR